MQTNLRSNFRSAFTFIEIMIVVALLGILAAIVIPQFTWFSTTNFDKWDGMKQQVWIRDNVGLDYSLADSTAIIKDQNGRNWWFESVSPTALVGWSSDGWKKTIVESPTTEKVKNVKLFLPKDLEYLSMTAELHAQERKAKEADSIAP